MHWRRRGANPKFVVIWRPGHGYAISQPFSLWLFGLPKIPMNKHVFRHYTSLVLDAYHNDFISYFILIFTYRDKICANKNNKKDNKRELRKTNSMLHNRCRGKQSLAGL